MEEYDFVIIGAGAAGLMLADGLGKEPAFRDKTILIIDKDAKKANDRTWCFWEQGPGPFDSILHKKWDHIYFAGNEFKSSLSIAPYSYKMVQGIDFYTSYLERIQKYPNVFFVQKTVLEISELPSHIEVIASENHYKGKQVFDSRFHYDKIHKHSKYPILQQHFVGWFVKTKQPVFNASQATFMDFSIQQKGNTRFMYVLPFSETEALVEYTLFSEKLLPEQEYEMAIEQYMASHFKCTDFEILEKEKGSIPMTCYEFAQHNTQRIFYIGTAGGWSKPSTGFTFRNTAKKSTELIEFLKTNKPLRKFTRKNRYWYFDLLMLNILYRNNELGRSIFEALFKKRSPQLILKFLDEETTWYEDIWITMAPKPIPFFKSLFRHLFWGITHSKKQW